jgi:hypothetical protein
MSSLDTQIWKDIDLSFEAHPFTGDLLKATGKNAIHQQIEVLLNLHAAEILFRTDIPGGLFENLFEVYITEKDPRKRALEKALRLLLSQHVTRIEILSVELKFDEAQNQLNCTILYRDRNDDQTYEYQTTVKRIR